MEKRKISYSIFRNVLGVLFRAYYRPQLVNKEIIPKEGPIIVCGNHIHLFDQCGPCLSTKRMLHYMAKKEYFDGPFAWFFKLAGCILVDRENHKDDAKDKALQVLGDGNALGIYPEGTRNALSSKKKELQKVYDFIKPNCSLKKFQKIMKKQYVRVTQVYLLDKLLEKKRITKDEYKNFIYNLDDNLKRLLKEKRITLEEYDNSLLLPLKFGTVSLAEKTKATIVPYAITGKYKCFNNKLKIIFGKPFKVHKMTIEEANQKLTTDIINLIKTNS